MANVATQQALPFYGDDVEPYKSATPSTFNAILGNSPAINHPNPSLMVKIVVFVGADHFYSEIAPYVDGYVRRHHYSPSISHQHPKIELNSVIEICGTIQDIESRNYKKITHRVLCNNIYHHHTPPKSVTNPPQIVNNTSMDLSTTNITTSSSSSLPPANQQWTNDDVARLLCQHWYLARQYSLTAKLTHDDEGVEMIGYYDGIPTILPSPPRQDWDQSNHRLMFGTIGIISSIVKHQKEEYDQVNFLIPTLETSPLSTSPGTDIMSFNLTAMSCRTCCEAVLPAIGSCFLLFASNYEGDDDYVGYVPLLSQPHDSSTPASSEPTEFTPEMFQKSSYMTDPVTNATLLKLVNHHNKLCQNIVVKKYDKDNLPPRNECIDITTYFDITDPVQIQKEQERLEQEKLRKEREEKQKQEEEQRRQQYQQRVQKLQSDTQFIHDLMGYHRNVTILPTTQKVMQQHSFLSDYITAQIITPFQHYQQEVHDYLVELYSQETLNALAHSTPLPATTTKQNSNNDNDGQQQEQQQEQQQGEGEQQHQQQSNIYNIHDLPPSPLESLMYHDYKDFIQGVQSTLFTLSSSSSTSPFFQSLFAATTRTGHPTAPVTGDDDGTGDDTTISTCYDSESKAGASISPIPLTTPLLQLQQPHIYHHAHTTDPHRVEAIQRQHQRVLLATSRDLPLLSSTTRLPPTTSPTAQQHQQFASLSTTNHSLNNMLNKVDPVINYLLSDENPTTTTITTTMGQDQEGSHQSHQSFPPDPLQQQQQYDLVYHQNHQLTIANETLRDLLIGTKYYNDELLNNSNHNHNNDHRSNNEDNEDNATILPLFVQQPTSSNLIDIDVTTALKNQIQQLQQQLQDTREDFKQQIETKDKQLEQQLSAKDKQIIDIQQSSAAQLAAKDKQIHQLLDLMSLTSGNR